jgi:hypothetical protein
MWVKRSRWVAWMLALASTAGCAGIVVGVLVWTVNLHSATHGCLDLGYNCPPNWAYDIVFPTAVLLWIVFMILWRLSLLPPLRRLRQQQHRDGPNAE